MRAHLEALKPEHADFLTDCARFYPSEVRLSEEQIRHKLGVLQEFPFQLSWILHDRTRCLGYILLYPRFSSSQTSGSDYALYIDELYVRTGSESYLYRLLKAATGSVQEAGLAELPLEAICLEQNYHTFVRHDRLVRNLGWRLLPESVQVDSESDVRRYHVCWAPVSSVAGNDTIDLDEESIEASRSNSGLVTLEDSERYAYRPELGLDEDSEVEEDEFESLTQIMVGQGEDGLVGVLPKPPVNLREVEDGLGIRNFFGMKREPKSRQIVRELGF